MPNPLFYSGQDVAAILLAATQGNKAVNILDDYLRSQTRNDAHDLVRVLISKEQGRPASQELRSKAERIREQATR